MHVLPSSKYTQVGDASVMVVLHGMAAEPIQTGPSSLWRAQAQLHLYNTTILQHVLTKTYDKCTARHSARPNAHSHVQCEVWHLGTHIKQQLASPRACRFDLGPRRLDFSACWSHLNLTSDDPMPGSTRVVTGDVQTRPRRAKT